MRLALNDVEVIQGKMCNLSDSPGDMSRCEGWTNVVMNISYHMQSPPW